MVDFDQRWYLESIILDRITYLAYLAYVGLEHDLDPKTVRENAIKYHWYILGRYFDLRDGINKW